MVISEFLGHNELFYGNLTLKQAYFFNYISYIRALSICQNWLVSS